MFCHLLILAAIFTPISKNYVNIIVFISVLFVFEILAYIRYVYKEKVNIIALEEKWEKKTTPQRFKIAYCASLTQP